jgi:hypothetical protein
MMFNNPKMPFGNHITVYFFLSEKPVIIVNKQGGPKNTSCQKKVELKPVQ